MRRTDRNHHFTEEQQHRFYLKAFEIYRGRYNTEVTEVIFLAVSDDVKWIKVDTINDGLFSFFMICNVFSQNFLNTLM